MNEYGLKNYVKKYTRIAYCYFKKLKSFKTSKTLIDIAIHNSNEIVDNQVFGCPFSDHQFVLTSISIKPNKVKNTDATLGRQLTTKNLEKR